MLHALPVGAEISTGGACHRDFREGSLHEVCPYIQRGGTKINIEGFERGDHLSEYKDYFINHKLRF